MIYENVLKLCEQRGISIAALERELGFGNATVKGWSRSMPRVNNVKAVADFFGVSIDDLLREHPSA